MFILRSILKAINFQIYFVLVMVAFFTTITCGIICWAYYPKMGCLVLFLAMQFHCIYESVKWDMRMAAKEVK